jgi:hypothetical protein
MLPECLAILNHAKGIFLNHKRDNLPHGNHGSSNPLSEHAYLKKTNLYNFSGAGHRIILLGFEND